MKVVVVTPMYPTAARPARGAFIKTQVEALRRAGIEMEVLALDGPRRKLAYIKGLTDLRARLERGDVDLVHAHYGYAGMIARLQRSAALVVSYCGDDLLGTVDASGRIRPLSRVTVAGGRLLAPFADAVIVKSAEMAERVKHARVYVIPHEVDFQTFRPIDRDRARRALGLDESKSYLLFAADPRIAVKRFPLAAAAHELVRRNDPDVELLVVHKETQERLALFFNAADALLFTSFQEGSPNVVKQAMACNLPIISTDVGDVSDVIGGTEFCFVCPPDPSAFAARAVDILARAPRTSGREAIPHLNSETLTTKVVDVYTETLHRKQADRRGRTSRFHHLARRQRVRDMRRI